MKTRREDSMKPGHALKVAAAITVFAGVIIAGMFFHPSRSRAQDGDEDSESRIQRGFALAPVPLNLTGKNLALVGLGSYLVNAAGGCNDCHSAGPQTQFVRGFNPYFGAPKKVNPTTYLGGGRNFGPLIPCSANIISRNLTPDKSGLSEGGNTFDQFAQIMRTGVDLDHLHPTCSGAPNPGCVPPPFDGRLLQIMPWPVFQDLTDHDLRAIYEYLSAIPCVHGNYPGEPPDRCG